MSLITLKNEELTVAVDTLGAQLMSVKNSDGKEYIWQGDPKYWEDRAPILFPIVSRLKNGEYSYKGQKYQMGMHGFARSMEFSLEKQSKQEAVFLLKSNEETLKCYPFQFEFRVVYSLKGRSLSVDFITENKTDGDMYYSAGSHEGYNITGDVSNYSIVLSQKETLGRFEVNDKGQIEETPTPCLENENELKLSEEYFKIDAIIFFDIKSKSVELRDDRTGEKILVEYPDADTLLIWREPNAPFVCIEPWSGAPDLEWKAADDFSEKYRIRKLSKGKSETLSHTITF